MGLFVTEARAVLLASLAIMASEAVGVSETTQRGFDPLPLAHVEQISASENRELRPDILIVKDEIVGISENRGLRLDLLISKTETIRATGTLQVGLNPLFISLTDSLKVWEWRVFPLGEHEVYGVPIRVFMKGRT